MQMTLPWGAVVFGQIHPFVYAYEIERGVWHWMGKVKDLTTEQTSDDVIRSACERSFRNAPRDVVQVYAAVTPQIAQQLCADCRLPQDVRPPTLSYESGQPVEVIVPNPDDPRPR